ncbi:MAG TPA: imidazole glycerol phosphate synthase subunit HisH [Bacteroidetes bacterium]|nr:imidazole glycerol phosphate synthase subunit HisH [Bacteroidota bacterium]
MISIIDYKAGNLASVSNALERMGVNFQVTYDTTKLDNSDAIIFPGVGHAQSAMHALDERNLIDWLKTTKKPVLGICLGMQLLYESSEEGNTEGLGIIHGRLRKFDDKAVKVPHLGWNDFAELSDHPITAGLGTHSMMYYVHSYYAPVNESTLAYCHYEIPFASVVAKDNFWGVQFHPEKSGHNGEILLKNYIELIQKLK